MLSLLVYVGQEFGERKPTLKGITVNVLTLPMLICLLQIAEARVRPRG